MARITSNSAISCFNASILFVVRAYCCCYTQQNLINFFFSSNPNSTSSLFSITVSAGSIYVILPGPFIGNNAFILRLYSDFTDNTRLPSRIFLLYPTILFWFCAVLMFSKYRIYFPVFYLVFVFLIFEITLAGHLSFYCFFI